MWLDDESKANELSKQNGLTNPSVGAGGGSGSSAAQSNNTTGTPSAAAPQTVQKFATAQDYLKANQPQAEDLGQKVTSTLGSSLGTEKSAIDTAANKTFNDIQSGTTQYNADLTNTALKDPTKITNDPNQLKGFLNQYNASYTGPNSFETSANYAPAGTAANEASQYAGELGSEGGRQQILQDKFNVYGQGNKGLDAALLQSSSAEPTLQGQAKDFGSIQDYLKNQSTNVSTAAQKAQADTDAAKTQTQNAFANNLTNFQTDLGGRVKAAQDAATTQANTYTSALKSGDATQVAAALKTANLTDAQRNNLNDYLSAINQNYGSNPDLSNFYTANPATDINSANVASKDDYDKAAAYKALTGVDYSGVLNPADAAKAGTVPDVNSAVNAKDADMALRQYLIQKEIESLNPQTTPASGGSTPPTSPSAKRDILTAIGASNPAIASAAFPIGAAAKGILNVGNKISSSLGFGGGKGDTQVNLPELKLPPMAIPKTANAATTKAITDIYNKPLDTSGSYHEGAAYDMLNRLDTLRASLQSGQISPDEYNAYALPLAQWANNAINTIGGGGSSAAKSISGGLDRFQKNSYLSPAQNQDSFRSTGPQPAMRAL